MPAQDKSYSQSGSPFGPCPGCGSGEVHGLPEFAQFRRVTSDCRAWPAGGQLAVCGACALTFKPTDAVFRREARDIYASYAIYHQSAGNEQRVRHSESGRMVPRSSALVDALLEAHPTPDTGSLLDIGCGNGAFLKAFSSKKPGWILCGTEHDRRHAGELNKIGGFKTLFTEALPPKESRFILISMIHLFEHVKEPVKFLKQAAERLEPSGTIFVQCPDASQNPFDVLIADHSLHLTPQTLAGLSGLAGLHAQVADKPWIPKEISARLSPKKSSQHAPADADPKAALARARGQLAWLRALTGRALELSQKKPVGIFGTSIGGTWLAGELGNRIGFFVDEDPDRVGSDYLGRPVLDPGKVRARSDVLVALAPATAEPIARRLSGVYPNTRWNAPSPL